MKKPFFNIDGTKLSEHYDCYLLIPNWRARNELFHTNTRFGLNTAVFQAKHRGVRTETPWCSSQNEGSCCKRHYEGLRKNKQKLQ